MNNSRPKVRISRAIGLPLTRKCVKYFERRPFPPGMHGRGRRKASDYSVRLMEKQRLRHQYNVSEKQLRSAFDAAVKAEGKTGENLVRRLECRLDAVVYRAGLARSIYQARQLVAHGHFTVDGTKVDRPSFLVKVGSTVRVRESSRTKPPFQLAAAGANHDGPTPSYLGVNLTELSVSLLALPERRLVPVICDEQLVVEYYSR